MQVELIMMGIVYKMKEEDEPVDQDLINVGKSVKLSAQKIQLLQKPYDDERKRLYAELRRLQRGHRELNEELAQKNRKLTQLYMEVDRVRELNKELKEKTISTKLCQGCNSLF